jgi:Tfp pilus assembly protein PilN
MLVFNKSRAVIDIEPTVLRYQIVGAKTRGRIIDNKKFIDIPYQDSTDVELFLQNLKHQAPSLTTIELNLSNNFIQYQQTAYPDVTLTVSELALYVEASLYKLFQQSVNQLFFDFVPLSGSPKALMIAVCQCETVNYWVDLCQKYGFTLLFVGSHFEDNQFNFLPWRKQKAKQHQFKLFLFVISLVGGMVCLFFYLLINTQANFDRYSKQVSEQQVLQQALVAELSSYFPHPSPSQKQIQQSLQMFSETLPATIWLNLYEYEAQKINITGRGINYLDIINFNQQLSAISMVNKSQVKNIENNNDSLLFQMDVELNE